MPTRYYIRLPDPANARGPDPTLAFRAHGAHAFAEELQHALRTDVLFQRWRQALDDPDDADTALGATDPEARVHGHMDDLHVDLEVVTSLPSTVLRQRLDLLAGKHWELRDVAAD